MQDSVLVTGASGNVGREVVRSLLAQGEPVIAASVDEQEAARMTNEAEVRLFRFGEPETFPSAFSGVRKLFLMRPPQIADVKRFLFPVVDYAKSVGVVQIAFLSLLGVEDNRMVPHYKVEQYLKRSGVPYTFLRPSFYMQNLNTIHRDEIRDHNDICVPVGKAKTSFIDVRDIGAVAALVLSEGGHENQAYALTGCEALNYYEVAERFTEILGRKIIYRNPSAFTFMRRSLSRRVPLKFVFIMTALYTATRFGSGERVTGTVERLLGRPPITMRQYIQDYAAMWDPAKGLSRT